MTYELTNLSHLDLYFYAELIVPQILDHSEIIDKPMSGRFGVAWRQELETRADGLMELVNVSKLDKSETNRALINLKNTLIKTPKWRETMTGFAHMAEDKGMKDRLMRSSGTGKGSPRSLKEQKDFWAEIIPHVQTDREEFLKVGVPSELLDMAKHMANELHSLGDALYKERAEDKAAMQQLHSAHQSLSEFFYATHHAVNASKNAAALLGQTEVENRADMLRILMDTALVEARINSQKESTSDDVAATVLLTIAEPIGGGVPGGAIGA